MPWDLEILAEVAPVLLVAMLVGLHLRAAPARAKAGALGLGRRWPSQTLVPSRRAALLPVRLPAAERASEELRRRRPARRG